MPPEELRDEDFLLIRQKGSNDENYNGLNMDVARETVVDDSATKLWWKPRTLGVKTGYNQIGIKAARSSLFAFDVTFQLNDKCRLPSSSVILRQYIQEPQQSRVYHFRTSLRFTTSTDGLNPFVPFNSSLLDTNYLRLAAIVPSVTCEATAGSAAGELVPDPIKVTICLSLSATMANLVLRYRTLVISFTVGTIVLVILCQLLIYNSQKVFLSVRYALSRICGFPSALIALAFIALHMCLLLERTRYFFRFLQLYPSESTTTGALRSFSPDFEVYDIFLGIGDSSLWFLSPLFFYVSLGLVWISDVILQAVIFVVQRVSSLFLLLVSSKSSWIAYSMRRRLVFLTMTMVVGAMLVPFQISFILCAISQLCVVAYADSVLSMPSRIPLTENTWKDHNASAAASNYANYCRSLGLLLAWTSAVTGPTVAVWLHNFEFAWYLRGPSLSNGLSVAGVILEVEACTRDRTTLPIFKGAKSKVLMLCFTGWFAVYSFVYGVSHLFMLPLLVNVYCLSAVLSRLVYRHLQEQISEKCD